MEETKKKKHRGLKAFGLILLAAAILLLAVLPVMADGTAEESTASILQTQAERKTMERTVAGGGSLRTPDPTEVTVPDGVRITKVLTANGETVEFGDPLAEVDRISVINAITSVQESLDSIASDMSRLNVGTTVITVDEEGDIYANGKAADGDKLADYAEYLSLTEQHREYEELLQELIGLFLSGRVTAPAPGLVDGVNRDAAEPLAFQGQARLILLADGEDPEPTPTYVCFAGIVKTADGATVNLLMNPLPFEISNFTELGETVRDTANMTTAWTFPGVYPVYQYAEETWSVSGMLQQLQPGDLVLCAFSGDMSESWIMQIGHGELPRERQDNGGKNGFHAGSFGTGAARTEEETELYSTKTTALCSVYPLGEVSFTIAVDEAEVQDLCVGMEAEVTVDALPGQTFTGTVSSVSRFGSGNGGSAKFDTVISLPMSEGMLPGMNACALLTAECFPDVLTIPAAALYDRADGSSFVYTRYDEKEQTLSAPVEVETGFCDGDFAEILSGLTEGDTVVYEYYDRIPVSNLPEAKVGFRFGLRGRR